MFLALIALLGLCRVREPLLALLALLYLCGVTLLGLHGGRRLRRG